MAAGFQRVGCSTEKKKPIWHIVVAEIEKKNTVLLVISASTTLSVEKKIASFPAKALLGVQRFCGGQKQKITAQVRELVKVAT